MRKRWGLARRLVSSFVVLVLSLITHHSSLITDVWADEPSTSALKAEIDALKSRLAQLERQVASGGSMQGTTSIGEKGVPGLVELPSGLSGLGISGYADVSYVYNLQEPSPNSSTGALAGPEGGLRRNRGRVFDTEPNGFTPHAFELVFEKPMSDEMPIGFRADIFGGDDADVIGSTGLANAGNDQFDLQQAYITAKAPIGEGVDFKVGKFVTLLGAEVIESPANWNFSRSYMFGYSIPFTHTGALASYPLGEFGSVTGGVVNGWDIVDDNNKFKSLIGNITLAPMENLTLAMNGITGAETAGDSNDDRSVLDLVATYQATDQLTLMANYDYGHDGGAATASGETGADWTGLALYAKYDMTPTWSLAGRWEWFSDNDNVRTGFTGFGVGAPPDIDFQEWTLTSQWKLYEHVLARLEYRHDWADQPVFFHDTDGFSKYQDTVAAELIYHF